jgi:D-alanyl-D-alanine carboxypeptidase
MLTAYLYLYGSRDAITQIIRLHIILIGVFILLPSMVVNKEKCGGETLRMQCSKWMAAIVAVVALATAVAPQDGYAKTAAKKQHAKSAAPQDHFSALVVDADTGHVLYQKNAASIRYPASLTKMMTLYLTFDALKRGKLKIDDTVPVSAKGAAQPQTNISLEKGDRLPVRTAIESIVVRSANDSAMVLGEAIGGTEWNFALLMSKKARELGMKNTIFRNPSGLPDNQQHTNAFDMAKLAIALRRDFPQQYHYFSMASFNYRGVTYQGHNHVMARYAGVDGVKTGYIRASGYNLVTSAHRSGHNLVAVILGGTTITGRDDQMIAMLDRTFAQLASQHKSVAKNVTEETDTKKNGTLEASNAVSR